MFKVLISVAYIYLHSHFIDSGDIFTFLRDAETLHNWAASDFQGFVRLCFGPSGTALPADLEPAVIAMGYWGDKSAYLLVRIHTLIWFLSQGFIYTHGLFFAALSCLGIHFIMKAWRLALGSPTTFGYFALMLFPSFAFWSSGIHKEAVWLFGAGLLIWSWVRIRLKGIKLLPIIALLIGSWLLFVIRDFSLYVVLIGLVAYSISAKTKPSMTYWRIGSFYVFLILSVIFLPPLINITGVVEILQQKQAAFQTLKIGDTHIDIPEVERTIDVFVKLPLAFFKAAISPIRPITGLGLSWLLIFDNLLLLIGFFTLFIHLIQGRIPGSFSLSCLMTGIFFLLICGFIVPNLGAMSRYRLMALTFLLPGFFAQSKFNLKFYNYVFK